MEKEKGVGLRRAVKVNTVEEMKGETELKVTVDLSPLPPHSHSPAQKKYSPSVNSDP